MKNIKITKNVLYRWIQIRKKFVYVYVIVNERRKFKKKIRQPEICCVVTYNGRNKTLILTDIENLEKEFYSIN